jgi:hypothetical protein
MQGGHGPLARPAGLPARLSGAGRTVGNGLRMQTERLTRTVRVCNRSVMPDFSAPLPQQRAGPCFFSTIF